MKDILKINYILKDINLRKSMAVDQLLNYLNVGKNNTEFGRIIISYYMPQARCSNHKFW